MAIKSLPCYWIECDGCGVQFEDSYEASMYLDRPELIAEAEYECYWLITDDGHWCPDCRGKHEGEDEAAGKTKTGSDDDESSDPID